MYSNKPLLPFEQHGFQQITTSGESQVVGICPFCGGDKFHLNPSVKAWDCKHCGKEGGYQKFLQQINEHCQDQLTDEKCKWLASHKGLSPQMLRQCGVGYNPLTDRYTFPMPEIDNSKLWNIYIYNPKNNKMIGTSGGNNGLIGWQCLKPSHSTIWLCEGHWDYVVMCEILDYMDKNNNEIALAVPGVNTFKDEWISFFQDKNVYVIYDADKDKQVGNRKVNAADEGRLKVYNKLKRLTKDLKFMAWENNLKDGYDLRDLYHETDLFTKSEDVTIGVYNYILERLESVPSGIEVERLIDKNKIQKSESVFKGNGLQPIEIYNRFTKWLQLKNTDAIDVFYGTILANRLPGDPVWMFLVGPSGCGKSELMLSIRDAIGIFSIDSLTPATLVSGSVGAGGSDPSLIPKLDGMVLAIKDFTTILEMNVNARDEIFGQLRSAYDGDYNKPFGTGTLRSYDSQFGILAGVTRAIELYTDTHTALGERFLRYHMPLNKSTRGRQAVILRALNNIRKHDKDVMRKELREIGNLVLDFDFGDSPELSDELALPIVYLADWVSIMRGSVVRDKYSKEVLHKAFIELGTRLATQFGKLALGIALLKRKKEVTMEEFNILKQIALGSVPSRNEEILRKIYKADPFRSFDIDDLLSIIKLPSITLQRILENLYMLGALQKIRLSKIKTKWQISRDLINTMKGAGIYE